MIIGINPSSQGFNQVGGWNEAIGCYDIAHRVKRLGDNQNLDIRIYWGGDQRTSRKNIAGIRGSIAWAKADKVNYFLSFHTDSAGDKRGYTGSLLLYRNNWGRIFGEKIAGIACARAGIPFYASRRRTNLLVLRSFQKIPCALIEIANHSDKDDLRLLLDPLWRERYAEGFVEGLLEYLGKHMELKGEIEVSSFQAVPTIETRIDGTHFWFDGLYAGKGDFGKGRVFMTVRLDEENIKGRYKFAVIPKDTKQPIAWSNWHHLKHNNRSEEVEFPEGIGNFSLHIIVDSDAGAPRVSVNQMYK